MDPPGSQQKHQTPVLGLQGGATQASRVYRAPRSQVLTGSANGRHLEKTEHTVRGDEPRKTWCSGTVKQQRVP